MDSIRLYDSREQCTTTVDAERVGQDKFRLMSNSLCSEDLSYGTLIRADYRPGSKDVYDFVSVIESSSYTQQVYGLNYGLQEDKLREIGEMITSAGGYWEVVFGGIAYVNLPMNSTLDVEKEIKKRKTKQSV